MGQQRNPGMDAEPFDHIGGADGGDGSSQSPSPPEGDGRERFLQFVLDDIKVMLEL